MFSTLEVYPAYTDAKSLMTAWDHIPTTSHVKSKTQYREPWLFHQTCPLDHCAVNLPWPFPGCTHLFWYAVESPVLRDETMRMMQLWEVRLSRHPSGIIILSAWKNPAMWVLPTRWDTWQQNHLTTQKSAEEPKINYCLRQHNTLKINPHTFPLVIFCPTMEKIIEQH